MVSCWAMAEDEGACDSCPSEGKGRWCSCMDDVIGDTLSDMDESESSDLGDNGGCGIWTTPELESDEAADE